MSSPKASKKDQIDTILEEVRKRDPNQKEFLQAVDELVGTIRPLLNKQPKYIPVLWRLLEPERAIIFRVPWVDDEGNTQVNRGFRVQFSSTLGPYKGGLRFHPTVNLSIVKFLGFEQIFKNALTTLPLGGGKGGSDFDPKGKSDNEVMRFCQSFMTELYRHIGQHTDVPAGDIGVGGREIGFLYGQYKRLANRFTGTLTGKNPLWGGSLLRPEATGFGVVYYFQELLKDQDIDPKGLKVLISGSGNVAQFCAMKLIEIGCVPITLSDSSGTVYEKDGFTKEKLEKVMKLKNEKRGRLSEYAKEEDSAEYLEGKRPWDIEADFAMPCATQNEIEEEDAKNLVKNGLKGVIEGANMPSTAEAIEVFKDKKLFFGPAKAANAGGVAVSGLEMVQDHAGLSWEEEKVDEKLQEIMESIFKASMDAAKEIGQDGDLQAGANLAAFKMVADGMLQQGVV